MVEAGGRGVGRGNVKACMMMLGSGECRQYEYDIDINGMRFEGLARRHNGAAE